MKLTDKIEKVIYNSLKTIGLITLYLSWSIIFIILFKLFNIDINKLNINQKMVLTIVSDITFFIFIIILYQKKLFNDLKKYFNKNIDINIKESLKYWGIGLLIMIISNIIISIITNGKIAGNEEAVRNLIKSFPAVMAFEVAIYAPITEELLFRHSIKQITDNKYIYPIISGLIFGGLHVIPSITSKVDLLFLIPYTSLGIAFACLYQKTNNIFSSIVAHSIHNTLAFILLVSAL